MEKNGDKILWWARIWGLVWFQHYLQEEGTLRSVFFFSRWTLISFTIAVMSSSNENVNPEEASLSISPGMRALVGSLSRGSKNSVDEVGAMRVELERLLVKELKTIAKLVGVRLTGATRKADIVERLIAMSQIDAIRQEGQEGESAVRLTYVTADVRDALSSLPGEWIFVTRVSFEHGH